MSTNLSSTQDIVSTVRRADEGFSFVENLVDFVNNKEFSDGYKMNVNVDGKLEKINKDSYIWATLSAIGEDVGDVIYTNVLKYIDLASNIDLCKTKALRSMISAVGTNYSIFDSIEFLPIEIEQVLDVLSINKKYLTDSHILREDLISDMISSVSSEYKIDNEGETTTLSVFDEAKYKSYLSSLYYNLLSSNIYLKYDDLDENGNFIYQNISNDLLGINTTISGNTDIYKSYKVKYSIDMSFNPSDIVDAIDTGKDDIKNYDGYELELINMEKDRRATPYSVSKPWTKYAYYKEQKVKEYVQFVESKIFNDNEVFSVDEYKIDRNLILVDNIDKQHLIRLVENSDGTNSLSVDEPMLSSVADTLATITLYISEIRDKVKTQTQRHYIKGTFNLLSYIINEYLIGFALTDKFRLEAQSHLNELKKDPDLSSFANSFNFETDASPIFDSIKQSLSSHMIDDVRIREYDDVTEYYNLSTDNSRFAQNRNAVVVPYWTEDRTNDVTLKSTDSGFAFDDASIEKYYMDVLRLRSQTVQDGNELDRFLSTVYSMGADNSYVDSSTGKIVVQDEETKNDIFLNYHGTDIGYYPFYNHKNITHSSYQVHPYLYNLIDHVQLSYPVTNAFYNDINNAVIYELTMENLNKFIGEHGETVKIWINNCYDYSGYKTAYESVPHTENYERITDVNEVVSYSGAFYPKAVEELYIHDDSSAEFIAMVDSVKNQTLYDSNGEKTFYFKYYSHLNLTPQECEYIAQQLVEYYQLIRDIILRNPVVGIDDRKYDIYKYGTDRFGNHYVLYKTYVNPDDFDRVGQTSNLFSSSVLSEAGAQSDNGELLNNHLDYSDFNIDTRHNKYKERKNTLGELWVRFQNHPIAFPAFYGAHPQVDVTKNIINGRIEQLADKSTTVGETDNPMLDDPYHMRYFYDMELDTSNRSLFLMACPWGDVVKHSDFSLNEVQCWDRSDVIISKISYEFDNEKRRYILKLEDDSVADVDGIDCIGSSEMDSGKHFRGVFNTDTNITTFVYLDNISTTSASFSIYQYDREISLTSYQTTIQSNSCIGNNLYVLDENTNFVCGYSGGKYTFVVLSLQNEHGVYNYQSGFCPDYISATTTPTNKIDKNSFDSFTSDIYLVDVELNGGSFVVSQSNKYNLNSDASYIPSYAGTYGKNHLDKSGFYVDDNILNLELLGRTQNDLSTYIKYVCDIYNVTEDDTSTLESNFNFDISALYDRTYGRVFEDYELSNGLSGNLVQLGNPLLNTYKTEYDSLNKRFVWSINVSSMFKNMDEDKLSNYGCFIYNNNTYGKNPYFIGKLIELSASTIEEDNNLLDYFVDGYVNQSEVQSNLSGNIYVAGTYDYYNREINFSENNHINNISDMRATFMRNPNGDYYLNIVMDITDPDIPFFVESDTVRLLIYNKHDYSVYEFYHLLDTRGIVSGWNPPDDESFFDSMSRVATTLSTMYLSAIELSDYSELSDLEFFDGYNNIHFKIDEEVCRYITDSGYYYPGKNKNSPLRVLDLIDALNSNMVSARSESGRKINLLSDVWDVTNLFINQITPSEIIDNIGEIELSTLIDTSSNDVIRAYEDYDADMYSTIDPRVLSYYHMIDDGSVELSSGFEDGLSGFIVDNASVNVDNYIRNNDFDGFVSQFNLSGLFLCNTEKELPPDYNSSFIDYEPSLSGEFWDSVNNCSKIDKFFNVQCCYTNINDIITLYFNYYNFLNSPYIQYKDEIVQMDILKGSYLKLAPNEEGMLDIILQFKIYDFNDKLLAYKNATMATYRIFNISDDKPKFLVYKDSIIQRGSLVLPDRTNMMDVVVASGVFEYRDDIRVNSFVALNTTINVETSAQVTFNLNYDSSIIQITVPEIQNVIAKTTSPGRIFVSCQNVIDSFQIPFMLSFDTSHPSFSIENTYSVTLSDVDIVDGNSSVNWELKSQNASYSFIKTTGERPLVTQDDEPIHSQDNKQLNVNIVK